MCLSILSPPPDTLLEAHHASPLSSIQETSLVNPLARGSYYGHTMRRAVSMRTTVRRDLRPYSTQSGDLGMRPASFISQDGSIALSNRSSLISTQSSTISEACEKNEICPPVSYSPVETQDPEQTITSVLNVADFLQGERLANSVSERSVEADVPPTGSSQELEDEQCTITVTPL